MRRHVQGSCSPHARDRNHERLENASAHETSSFHDRMMGIQILQMDDEKPALPLTLSPRSSHLSSPRSHFTPYFQRCLLFIFSPPRISHRSFPKSQGFSSLISSATRCARLDMISRAGHLSIMYIQAPTLPTPSTRAPVPHSFPLAAPCSSTSSSTSCTSSPVTSHPHTHPPTTSNANLILSRQATGPIPDEKSVSCRGTCGWRWGIEPRSPDTAVEEEEEEDYFLLILFWFYKMQSDQGGGGGGECSDASRGVPGELVF